MKVSVFLAALCFTAVVGSTTQQKIIGGEETTIENYPFAAVILRTNDMINYKQDCGGIIINSRSVLTAGHCFVYDPTYIWRIRVGSSQASQGGSVHTVSELLIHPEFEFWFKRNDIGIMRIFHRFEYGNNVQPASLGGPDYILPDNTIVWTLGWGQISSEGPKSEQLKHVQIWTVNQNTCMNNYNTIAMEVTQQNICAGFLNEGGRDPCKGDYGGPLLHNNVVIGISSWGSVCGFRGFPSVYTHVPLYITWIQNNA